MAKVKTRLQYNSMGERVVVRTALDSIDAFATRVRQCSHPANQQTPQQPLIHGVSADHPGAPTENKLPETGLLAEAGDGTACVVAADGKQDAVAPNSNPHDVGSRELEDKSPRDDERRLGDAGSHTSGGLQDVSPPPPVRQTVSKSLGFGWPDFSSVGSKVGLPWTLAAVGIFSYAPSWNAPCPPKTRFNACSVVRARSVLAPPPPLSTLFLVPVVFGSCSEAIGPTRLALKTEPRGCCLVGRISSHRRL